MMSFEPTHEFRGLKLEKTDVLNEYRDDTHYLYLLPPSKVTRILPQPQPGEVWKYVGEYSPNSDYNMVLISDEVGPCFVNVEGDSLPFAGDDLTKPNFVKVLNADGTPA